ncbi:hypothetical protein C8R45DRAFT_941096 [Mycena sanguinolenta]|nr:hypothetical protein C8R45DRAFT_941096 [Mycena sanguinolenta]
MLSSILLNPAARLYTLRFLLIATVPTIYVSMTAVNVFGTLDQPSYHKGIFGLAMGIIIWAHHILAIFYWTLRGLAVIDLATVVIEICGLVYLTSTGSIESLDLRLISDTWLPSVVAFTILPVAFLFLSLLFRITTIMATKEKLLAQRFSFLGSCELPSPLYTPASILLNRSLARPLVRGESKYIISARAAVLSCIGVGVPAFGIYSTMIKPAHATVSSIWIPRSSRAGDSFDLPGGKATISFSPPLVPEEMSLLTVPVRATEPNGSRRELWLHGVISVAIGCNSGECVGLEFPILVLPGSRLFGSLAWSQRKTISQSGFDSGVIFSPAASRLQQDTSAEGNITSLTLSVIPYPIRFFQDTADASVLSGISAFGGFWTFVNGTFALFFGANIIYFASCG